MIIRFIQTFQVYEVIAKPEIQGSAKPGRFDAERRY
jgi:hypothetical protein